MPLLLAQMWLRPSGASCFSTDARRHRHPAAVEQRVPLAVVAEIGAGRAAVAFDAVRACRCSRSSRCPAASGPCTSRGFRRGPGRNGRLGLRSPDGSWARDRWSPARRSSTPAGIEARTAHDSFSVCCGWRDIGRSNVAGNRQVRSSDLGRAAQKAIDQPGFAGADVLRPSGASCFSTTRGGIGTQRPSSSAYHLPSSLI